MRLFLNSVDVCEVALTQHFHDFKVFREIFLNTELFEFVYPFQSGLLIFMVENSDINLVVFTNFNHELLVMISDQINGETVIQLHIAFCILIRLLFKIKQVPLIDQFKKIALNTLLLLSNPQQTGLNKQSPLTWLDLAIFFLNNPNFVPEEWGSEILLKNRPMIFLFLQVLQGMRVPINKRHQTDLRVECFLVGYFFFHLRRRIPRRKLLKIALGHSKL